MMVLQWIGGLTYGIIFAILISGSCATNTTEVLTTTPTTPTNSSQVTDTPLQTTEAKEMLDMITETLVSEVVYTEITNDENAAEIHNQALTNQSSVTSGYQTTQVTSLSNTSVDNVITTPITVSKPPETYSTSNMPLASHTLPTTEFPVTETTAANRPMTSEANRTRTQKITSLNPSIISTLITTLNPVVNTKTTTLNPVVSTRTTLNPVVSTETTTLNPVSATTTTLNPVINTRTTTLNPVISTRTNTLNPIISTKTTTLNPVISTRTTTLNPVVSTRITTLNPAVSTKTTTLNPVVSNTLTDEASSISNNVTTSMPDISSMVSESYTPTLTSNKQSATESERFMSSTSGNSPSSSGISINSTPYRNTTSSIRTTVSELVNTSTATTSVNISNGETETFVTFTTVIYEELSTTFTYVEDEKDTDDLPLLLIMISSTVGILVTLLIVLFAGFLCFAYKKRQRRQAKYYDYKKRWVKRAPRPKYEKVKQNYRHGDREAAGSGWVFQDGADPSKQITLELKPSNSQSSPEDISNNGKLKPLNFGALSETAAFPPDVLSSSSPSLEGALDFDDVRSALRLSKVSSDRADYSSTSDGDSGILALGDDLWSPTKGVPFHFVSDDAVIEL